MSRSNDEIPTFALSGSRSLFGDDVGYRKEISIGLHFSFGVNVRMCLWLLIPRCVKFACVKTNTLLGQ